MFSSLLNPAEAFGLMFSQRLTGILLSLYFQCLEARMVIKCVCVCVCACSNCAFYLLTL